MWFSQQLDPENPAFSGAQYVEIRGAIDLPLLMDVMHDVWLEVESVQVAFADGSHGPRQIRKRGFGGVHHADVSSEPDPRAAVMSWIGEEMRRPIRLTTGEPLATTAAFRLAEDHFIVVTRGHHIVMDGYSSGLVAMRGAARYTQLVTGGGETEPFGPADCLTAAARDYRDSAEHERDRAFWLAQFADRPQVVSFADGTARPSPTFLRETADVPPAIADGLRELARRAGTTTSAVLCAAAALYLAHMRDTREVVLALPASCRFGPDMKRTPGMVMNILPLRIEIDPAASCLDLVRQTSVRMRAALKHQRYRFEDLARDLRLGTGGRLFGPMVNVLPYQPELWFGEHRGTLEILSNGPVDDLNIVSYSGADIPGLRICLDANPALYRQDELRAHRDRFANVLASLAGADPALPAGRVAVLGGAERDHVLRVGEGETREVPCDDVADLFEAQAARTPHAVAVVHGDVELSYRELNERADRLARRLVSMGAGPERFVALAMPRSSETVVALLAVLKTGAAYLPIDLNYPAERIALMLEEAAPVLVLTTADAKGLPPGAGGAPRVPLDDGRPAAEPSGRSADDLATPDRNPLNPAYAIYTSGSTGRPKGVVITRAGMADLMAWAIRDLGAEALRHVLASISLSFDPSVVEIFPPLLTGGCVEVLDSPLTLREHVWEGTFATSVASIFSSLAADDSFGLDTHTLGFTGEALDLGVVAQVRERVKGCRIANLYGPTEVTVYGAAWYSGEEEVVAPPIGRPLPNTRLRVLDKALRPVPDGVLGELYIAGNGLARGYLGRPDLTAERFVADPFGPPGTRMYRTGDLVRRRGDGNLEYAGRTDHQVKVRGFRVELGEIESVLGAQPGVAKAAVLAHDHAAGGVQLVGYVLPLPGAELHIDTLRDDVARILPDYMVPAEFMVLDELPLNPNGKLDRRALPVPETRPGTARDLPRTPEEERLCALFAETLGRHEVGVTDDFFAMGGDSLLATKLLSRVRATLGSELDIRDFFNAPTVTGVDTAIRAAGGKTARPRPALRPRPRTAEEVA